MQLCKYGCGQDAKYQLKNGSWCCGKFHNSCPSIKNKNSESNKSMGSSMKFKVGKNNPNWKGGDLNWLHDEARRLFGVDTCEVCGMTEEKHIEKTGKTLHMHCDGKRYRNMERIFWTTCCVWCHIKIEALDKI